MNPFPLSSSDYSAFMNEVGPSLNALPSWGGIIQWHTRYVLAFNDANGNWRLTDISGGVPADSAPGGVVPIAALLHDIPRVETPAWEVFLYTLPGNILQVATERAQQLASAAANVADAAIKPLIPDLMPLAIAALAILAFMYLPKSRS